MYEIGMDLAKGDQRPGFGLSASAGGRHEKLSVALHLFARTAFRIAQIERFAAKLRAYAAPARAESVDEPGNALERGRLENAQSGRLLPLRASWIRRGCHGPILNAFSWRRLLCQAHAGIEASN